MVKLKSMEAWLYQQLKVGLISVHVQKGQHSFSKELSFINKCTINFERDVIEIFCSVLSSAPLISKYRDVIEKKINNFYLLVGRPWKSVPFFTKASLAVWISFTITIRSIPRLKLNTGPYFWAKFVNTWVWKNERI